MKLGEKIIEWEKVIICLFLLLYIVFLMALTKTPETGPWYLGCADRNGNELLLKTDSKPKVEGSLVFIGKDVFVTPEPGMTCRIVSVKQIEAEQVEKGVDKSI